MACPGGTDVRIRLGRGRQIVIEGDEYNTAFFDRGPKFLHYRPHLFLLGPVEFDHADIYRDLDAVMTAFRAGAAQVPRHGAVIVNAFSDSAVGRNRRRRGDGHDGGPDPDCTLQLCGFADSIGSAAATMRWQDSEFELVVPMDGRHNLHNAAMAAGRGRHRGTANGRRRRLDRPLPRRRSSPADRGRGRRHHGCRRLRPPPHRPGGNHRGSPGTMARPTTGGSVRATLSHRGPP